MSDQQHFQYLKQRAQILEHIRAFFKKRQVLELDTPLLYPYTIPDPYIESFQVGKSYLQTSPEFAMKRYLAKGIGSIYQLCKAFRKEEQGRFHHCEFTLLEWYRLGFTHLELMDETSQLLVEILSCETPDRITYEELFQQFFDINPHTCSRETLAEIAQKQKITLALESKDDYLFLLMSHIIEPAIGQKRPLIIYDFPASQSSLARCRSAGAYNVAERFEVYFKGMELANGFHELNDSREQRQRFLHQQNIRQEKGFHVPPIDEAFLDALDNLPHCAGVALGVDRLIMIACGADHIDQVTVFFAE